MPSRSDCASAPALRGSACEGVATCDAVCLFLSPFPSPLMNLGCFFVVEKAVGYEVMHAPFSAGSACKPVRTFTL